MSAAADAVESPQAWRAAWAHGLAALREQWIPLVAIQALAAATVAAYLNVPGFTAAVDRLADWRAQFGIGAAFAAGVVASMVLPEVVKVAVGAGGRWDLARVRRWIALGLTYGTSSIQVDWLYRFLSATFGDGVDPSTIARKILFDQFVFTFLYSVPYLVLMSVLIECLLDPERRWRGFVRWLWPAPYRRHILPVQLMGWAVWLPALVGIFSLPLPVQFPVAMLISSAWSVILSFITARTHLDRPEPNLREVGDRLHQVG